MAGFGVDWAGEMVYDKKGGMLMDKIETLKNWVGESSRIVFFGGAGVSTE